MNPKILTTAAKMKGTSTGLIMGGTLNNVGGVTTSLALPPQTKDTLTIPPSQIEGIGIGTITTGARLEGTLTITAGARLEGTLTGPSPDEGTCENQGENFFIDGKWVASEYCKRCGSDGHTVEDCVSIYHVDGSKLKYINPNPYECLCIIH